MPTAPPAPAPAGLMLSQADVQEELSLTYVRAVVSRAGFSVVEPVGKDRDSIDLQIRARGFFPNATLMSPAIDVQLKGHAIDLAEHPERIPYDLPVKNYNDLIPRSATPRILVIFAMPLDNRTWLDWTEDALVLRRAAYYVSLKGLPPTTSTSKKRVFLPRANVLNPETIRVLLERVANEEEL